MSKTWPRFVTKDLGDTPEDDAELHRRWLAYDTQMKTLIAAGGVHQDQDGWWVESASGELIGPDPEIERPRTEAELARAALSPLPLPNVIAGLKTSRGRPRMQAPKKQVSVRLDQDVLTVLRASGPGWQARMNDTLRKALGL